MGAAGRGGAGSVRLLYSREQPARGTVCRLAQVPDLLEGLGGRARFLAYRTGEAHARPVKIAFGDDLEQGRVQRHEVGLLSVRALLRLSLLEGVEHLLRGHLAQADEI